MGFVYGFKRDRAGVLVMVLEWVEGLGVVKGWGGGCGGGGRVWLLGKQKR